MILTHIISNGQGEIDEFFLELGRRFTPLEIKKPFIFIAKGLHRSNWLPKLVSQSVLLWDGMKIKMGRIVKDQTKITPLLQIVNFKNKGLSIVRLIPTG